MRLHRFIGNFDIHQDNLVITDKDLIHQLKNVFRANPGDEILLADGNGKQARAEVSELTKDELSVQIREREEVQGEGINHIILYCAVLKKDNFEWAVQKSVEVGISEIYPLLTERTVKTNLKLDRLEKIAREAAEQSGRGYVPAIHEPVTLDEALQSAESNQVNYVFHTEQQPLPSGSSTDVPRIGIFIGPEGGWNENELATFRDNKMVFAGLGGFHLRSETAAIVSAYLMAHGGG